MRAASTPAKAPPSIRWILPPPPSSAGVPENQQATAQVLHDLRRRQSRAEAGGGDDVVPAGVADAGQRVVLAEERHEGSLGPGAGREGRLHAVGLPLDLQPRLLGRPGEQIMGEVLLESQLGVLVDAVGDLGELGGACLHRGPRPAPLTSAEPGEERTTGRIYHRPSRRLRIVGA